MNDSTRHLPPGKLGLDCLTRKIAAANSRGSLPTDILDIAVCDETPDVVDAVAALSRGLLKRERLDGGRSLGTFQLVSSSLVRSGCSGCIVES